MTTEFKTVILHYYCSASVLIPKNAEVTGDKWGVVFYELDGIDYKAECNIHDVDYKNSDDIEEVDADECDYDKNFTLELDE